MAPPKKQAEGTPLAAVRRKGHEAQAAKRDQDLESRGITKETVHRYFIVENHTLAECAEHFSIPYSTFRKLLRRWNIAKTQKEAAVRGKATFIERYGEDSYRNRLSKIDGRVSHAKSVESRRKNTQARLNAAGLTRRMWRKVP